MSKGGARPGAGRPRGTKNVKNAQRLAAVEASGLTPLAYLLNTMRDDKQDKAVRLDAAKAAAPYVHPKLATTVVKGDPEAPVNLTFTDAGL